MPQLVTKFSLWHFLQRLIQHTGRAIINITTGSQKSLVVHRYYFHPSSTLYHTFTNTIETLDQIFVACNPDKGFLCQTKVAHGYSYSGALIRRHWREKKHNEPKNCTVIFEPRLGDGVMDIKSRLSELVVVRCLIAPPPLSSQEQRRVEGTPLCCCGHRHLQ